MYKSIMSYAVQCTMPLCPMLSYLPSHYVLCYLVYHPLCPIHVLYILVYHYTHDILGYLPPYLSWSVKITYPSLTPWCFLLIRLPHPTFLMPSTNYFTPFYFPDAQYFTPSYFPDAQYQLLYPFLLSRCPVPTILPLSTSQILSTNYITPFDLPDAQYQLLYPFLLPRCAVPSTLPLSTSQMPSTNYFTPSYLSRCPLSIS